MEKIFITGSLGFIGSHIAKKLLEKKICIYGIDNFSGKYPLSYYKANLALLKKYKHFVFNKADILDKQKIELLIRKNRFKSLIHCAAKTNVRQSINHSNEYFRINVKGTISLINLVSGLNNKCRIIILSSSAVYGNQNKLPISENVPLQPLSPYGESKKQMEKEIARIAYQKKLDVTLVRPFSIYGPRGRRNMAPYLLYQAINNNQSFTIFGDNQTNQRDWTYIDDFVSGIAQIVNRKINGFAVFNLGAGFPIGIEDFVKQATVFFPDKSKVKIIKKPCRDYETSITWADTNKALKFFGFKPKTKFADGILKTYRAFSHEEE
jgi:UDP-glucuronate 4-epimerase